MNRLDFFKQLFGSLFGSRDSKPKAAQDLLFEETKDWIDQRTRQSLKELEKTVLNGFSEIQFLIKDIQTHLSELEHKEPEQEKANERLQKVVSSSQQTMVSRMKPLLQKLLPPRSTELEALHAYCSTAFATLEKETTLFGKNIAYTSLLHKDEVKGIGHRFEELSKILKELAGLFSGESVFEQVRNAERFRKELLEQREEHSKLQAESKRLEKELQAAEKNLAENETRLSGIKGSAEAREFEELLKEKQGLEEQKQAIYSAVLGLASRIEKPLKRFQQLVSSGNWIMDKGLASFLETLSRNPSTAFESDPNGQSFKSVLSEIQKAMDAGKISFKDEKEKNRHVESLAAAASFDFFSEFFWKQNELVRKRQRIEKTLASSPFSQNLSGQEALVQRLRKETGQLREQLSQNQSRLEKSGLVLGEKKRQLEGPLSKIAGTKTIISFSRDA